MSKELSPAKKLLLEKWLKGKHANKNTIQIPLRIDKESIQLSFPQQRQLFLELLDRHTAVNNLSVLLELKGDLNIDYLTSSANQIMERHEVLRTQFIMDKGMPTATLLKILGLSIPVIEMGNRDQQILVEEAIALVQNEVLKPFNLNQAPLIRLKLYKLDIELHYFLIVIHHTIADGWSLGVFLKELMSLYNGFKINKPIELDNLPIQYYDYASWQTSEQQMINWKRELDYWKTQLKGDLPVLDFPTDKTRNPRQSYDGSTYNFVLSKELTGELEQLSKRENVTLFMTLLSAFYIVLHRYSNQDEILIGTPVANRNLMELEELIGVFINILVLRLEIDGSLSFRMLLKHMKEVTSDALAHSNLPFEKLVEELKPKRDLSRTPLFQVLFNLQNSPKPVLDLLDIQCSFVDIDRGVSQFDLTLMLTMVDGQCQAMVEFNRDLFKEATITRLFKSFQTVLEHIIKDPEISVSMIPLVSRSEEKELIHEFSKNNMDFPYSKKMYELFEEQVHINPDKLALIYGQNKLSYQELNSKANRIGRYLRELGLKPGMGVGVLMHRSNEIVETIIGIHKAGGVYVPIHISYPNERIGYILQDADINFLVTNNNNLFIPENDVTIVHAQQIPFTTNTGNIDLKGSGDDSNLAYIIYTSGSTGEPKGVMINHYSLVNFLISMRSLPGINKNDVLLAVTNISFDISILELFLPLISGATVVMASEEMINDPDLITAALEEHKVSIMQATPVYWQLLVESGWAGKNDMKALCGGDVLTRQLALDLLKRSESLWNMYGPTETTIWSSVCKINKNDENITIGHPINNTQLYILDKHLQPLPPGITGELFIGGDGLAVGYLNNAELTKEKFVYSRFIQIGEACLYRTGDNARLLSNRTIKLLGRSDDQVKISGNRIELGEISSIVSSIPGISNGVTVTYEEQNGTLKLVVYYVTGENQSLTEEEIKQYLKAKLPPYMIPSYFIEIDILPLTPSGKIDRKALPRPGYTIDLSRYASPVNEEEKILARIWQNVLEIDEIGIHDNFFDLGGASIQTIQVVTKANMFGYRINVENLFEYQTIAELSKFIQSTKM
ncbi:non-ribosomal peptide synthetase [Tamlana flava]|uniref:non-ribosomal peptide synthetase n=1 Tax=Tamlana flava TaxID=3158572 RepID=UPI00351BC2F5